MFDAKVQDPKPAQEPDSHKDGKKEEGKNAKPQRQPGDPSGYNPGGYKAVITPTMKLRETNPGKVVVDTAPITELIGVMSTAVHPFVQKELGEFAPPQEEVTLVNLQMMNYLLAEQTVSSAPQSKAWLSAQYGKHLSNQISVPNGLVAVARQFGTIKDAEYVYEVSGHVILTSTFLMRGIGLGQEAFRGVVQNVDGINTITVDVAAAGIGIPIQQMPAAQVQQFNAQGVVFLDWDRRTHDVRFATFLADVQMPMAPVYERVFKMVEVAALANLGGTGQTVVRSEYETVVGVHKVGADQLDLGVLLAGEKSGVLSAAYPLFVQHSQAAVDHKNLCVRGMFKAG